MELRKVTNVATCDLRLCVRCDSYIYKMKPERRCRSRWETSNSHGIRYDTHTSDSEHGLDQTAKQPRCS